MRILVAARSGALLGGRPGDVTIGAILPLSGAGGGRAPTQLSIETPCASTVVLQQRRDATQSSPRRPGRAASGIASVGARRRHAGPPRSALATRSPTSPPACGLRALATVAFARAARSGRFGCAGLGEAGVACDHAQRSSPRPSAVSSSWPHTRGPRRTIAERRTPIASPAFQCEIALSARHFTNATQEAGFGDASSHAGPCRPFGSFRPSHVRTSAVRARPCRWAGFQPAPAIRSTRPARRR